MTLRTPRRRIAPRTIRRYRAIKDFLKRALGTPSDPELKTNSSEPTIEISVSDLKQKIVGIEDQLNKVSKHCQDIAYLDHNIRRGAEYLESQDSRHEGLKCENPENSKSGSKPIDTKVLYKTSVSQYKRSDESDHKTAAPYHGIRNNMATQNYPIVQSNEKASRPKAKHSKYELTNELNKWHSRHPSNEIHYACQSTSSFHSLYEVGYKCHSRAGSSKHDRQHSKRDCVDPIAEETKDRNKSKREGELIKNSENRHKRNKKKCCEQSDLDQEFIANIIKRQYKPVQLFGRKESDFSQISAPVCRDHEFRIREDVQQGSDLCSCCFDQHRRHGYKHLHTAIHSSDLSDMRSVCDARLYSYKKRNRNTCRREHLNDYNDSAYYDIIPVKEKSSPMTRRKFTEDNMPVHQQYKEVPPSPRTQRPRFNLKARPYEEYDNSYVSRKNRLPHLKQRYEIEESEDLSENIQTNVQNTIRKSKVIPKVLKTIHSREDVGTMSSLQYPNIGNEHNNLSNNDTTLNTQTTDVSVDKTDKTLCEIKDILQNFLTELKKESSHSNKSNGSSKIDGKKSNNNQENIHAHSNSTQKSGDNFNNYSAGQCNLPPQFLPPFPNPCCYPILPMCPMNCMQNGYVVPSPSFACTACTNSPKEAEQVPSSNKNPSKETQELIREIYKFVSQNPKPSPKKEVHSEDHVNSLRNQQSKLEKKLLTTRSVGGYSKASKHDARVGTPAMKCVSKSCEALGSRINSDTFYTNASYSDTILDKLSLEATQSSTESDVSSEASARKDKRNKFKKMFRSFGLWKKKKKDVIEELSESESTVEAGIKTRPPPFKQNITNYNMHGQEYFHPPPMPQHNYHSTPLSDLPHRQAYSPYMFDPRISPKNMYNQQIHDHNHYAPQTHRDSLQQHHAVPPNHSYHPHYNQMPPQVPLCLKEIEVKSIGTQSERKVSILNKFTKKTQPPSQDGPHQHNTTPPVKEKPALFNWKSFQEKAKRGPEAYDFSMKTQKQLAEGDMNMRNAMIKKLFYKRNPFSPRNLIVRTLLGKDPSSFGNPPKMYRPRMFL